LSTDVLSEGQNLQQAAQVISYDMPWNPQRVVQRYGRVIRLKSQHLRVTLTTMLPAIGELEGLLGLEATIRRKILSASVFGMDAEVVEGTALAELRAYAGRLADGDTQLLEDDSGAGGGAFVGEELRAELMRAISEGELARLRQLPWGVGTAFRQGPSVPSRGALGIFFACRVQGRRYWRYVESGGEVIAEEAEMLRRINPGGALRAEAVGIDMQAAWRAAAVSIVDVHNRLADPRAEVERLGPAQRFALDLLRTRRSRCRRVRPARTRRCRSSGAPRYGRRWSPYAISWSAARSLATRQRSGSWRSWTTLDSMPYLRRCPSSRSPTTTLAWSVG
jgi:hypothetical protein